MGESVIERVGLIEGSSDGLRDERICGKSVGILVGLVVGLKLRGTVGGNDD